VARERLISKGGSPPAIGMFYDTSTLAPPFLDTAGLGPGYDHSAVPGRTPLIRGADGQMDNVQVKPATWRHPSRVWHID